MKMAASRLRLPRLAALASATALAVTVGMAQAQVDEEYWWTAGSGEVFPEVRDYPNAAGALRVLVEGGPVDTVGHAFFEPIGPNGRACVTCHQPHDAMSLTPRTAQERWEATGGTDPLFAAWDGSNCPTMPQGERASHSLLLDHGLFRIERPWPPRDLQGNPIETDFTIEVVRDPWGCNTGRAYGLDAEEPTVSVYRRPRPVANLKYILAVGFDYDPKSGLAMELDPETGEPMSGNLMSDRRAQSLSLQMRDAAASHLEMLRDLTDAERAQIADFESRVYAAQQTIGDDIALDEVAEGGAELLQRSEAGLLGIFASPVWSEFDAWAEMSEEEMAALPPETRAFRESVVRGLHLWRTRSFLVNDSAGINQPLGFGNPARNTCQFCHNMSRTGIDVAPGQIDLGTSNQPFADPMPHLPLFRITCTGRLPHPHYGREILTSDPGYALTTGRCLDVGKITTQQMRAMAAREPLFHNGIAADIPGLVDFYDRRYNIQYTPQERQDMINLLTAL